MKIMNVLVALLICCIYSSQLLVLPCVLLPFSIPKLQKQAIATLRDMLVRHDLDHSPESRSHIALLYIPLLGIVMDNFTRLWRDFSNSGQNQMNSSSSDSREFDLGEDAEAVTSFFQNRSGISKLVASKPALSAAVSKIQYILLYAAIE